MNIASKDLNLLNIFVAIVEEQNLSRAGLRLGLSQPTVSHALSKLRYEFSDPLFVRNSRGVSPTPVAITLFPKVQQFLKMAEELYGDIKPFTLASVHDTIRIGTSDYIEQLIFPQVVKTMTMDAPGLTLISQNILGQLPKKELESGQLDIGIAGFFQEIPQSFYKQKIFVDHFVCLVCPNNSRIKGELTLETYLSSPHAMTTLRGDLHGIVDKELAKINRKRHIACALSNFLATGLIIEGSDMILTCLNGLAEKLTTISNLVKYPVPIKVPSVEIEQVWHERTNGDPTRKWMRSLIARTFQDAR